MKVVIKVSRRSTRIEVVQKRSVVKSPEEKNARGRSAKESLLKVKIEQEGEGLAEGQAKKFAASEGSEERRN